MYLIIFRLENPSIIYKLYTNKKLYLPLHIVRYNAPLEATVIYNGGPNYADLNQRRSDYLRLHKSNPTVLET